MYFTSRFLVFVVLPFCSVFTSEHSTKAGQGHNFGLPPNRVKFTEERNGRWQIPDEKSKKQTRDGFGIPGLLAEPTGTDGFRVLCHQFFPSSLPHLANCIRRCNVCEASEEPAEASSPPAVIKQRRPGPKQPAYGLPASHWTTVVQRVVEQKEPLRTVAAAYGVSHETIRRILLHVQKLRGQQEA